VVSNTARNAQLNKTAHPPVPTKSLGRTALEITAVALLLIGALALILLYANVLTPAILLSIALSKTSVEIIGISSLAVGGISLLALFAKKIMRAIRGPPPRIEDIKLGVDDELSAIRVPTKEELEEGLREALSAPNLPYRPYNFSIVSGIFGDAFTAGTRLEDRSLEGNNFGESMAFFQSMIAEVEAKGADAELLDRMRGSLDQAIEVVQVAKKVHQERNAARLFALWMQQKIGAMKEGERFLIPGGWKGTPGHAMLYEVTCITQDQFTFKTINTGSGLKYHTSAHVGNKHKFDNVLELKCSREDLLRSEPWISHYDLMYLDPDPQKSNRSAVDVYAKLLKSICPEFDGSERTLSTPTPRKGGETTEQDFSTPQRSGTCSTKVLFAYLKANAGSKKQYKALKFAIRQRTFESFVKNSDAYYGIPPAPDRETLRSKLAHIHVVEAFIDKFSRSISKAVHNRWISEEEAEQTNAQFTTKKNKCKTLKENANSALSLVSSVSLIPLIRDVAPKELPRVSVEPIGHGRPCVEGIKKDVWESLFTLKMDWKKPETLHLQLAEYAKLLSLKNNSEKFDNPRVHYVLRQFFESMPPATSSIWSNIPSEHSEACMVHIADLSDTFLRTQWSLPDPNRKRTYVPLLLEKALIVVQQIAKRLPKEDEHCVSRCCLDASYFYHSVETQSPESGYCFVTDPALERSLTETLIAGKNNAKRAARGIFFTRPTDFASYSFPIRIDSKSMEEIKHTITTRKLSDPITEEEVFVWKYLFDHPDVLAAVRKEVREELESQHADLKKKNAYYAQFGTLPTDIPDVPTVIPDHMCVACAMADTRDKFLPRSFGALKRLAFTTQFAHTSKLLTSDRLRYWGLNSFLHQQATIKLTSTEFSGVETFRKLEFDFRGELLTGTRALKEAHDEITLTDIETLLEKMFITEFTESFSHNSAMTASKLENHRLKREEYRDLLLLRCPEDKGQQAVKTIAYFLRNISKLKDKDYQQLFMSLIFERGVLRSQLMHYPEFAKTLMDFVKKGIKYSQIEEDLSTEVFFLRMQDHFQSYCDDVSSQEEVKEKEETKEIKERAEDGLGAVAEKLLTMISLPGNADDNRKCLLARELLASLGRKKNLVLNDSEMSKILKLLFYYHDNSVERHLREKNGILEDDITLLRNKLLFDLKLRSKERLSEIFSRAADFEPGDWDVEGFPLIARGQSRINLESGQLIINMSCSSRATYPHHARSSGFLTLFPKIDQLDVRSYDSCLYNIKDQFNYENIAQVSYDQHLYLKRMIPSTSLKHILEKFQVEQLWSEDVEFNLIHAEVTDSAFSLGCSHWYSADFAIHLFIDNQTGKIQYVQNRNGLRRVGEDGRPHNSYLANPDLNDRADGAEIRKQMQARLCAVDPHMEMWCENNVATMFELPRYQIKFTTDHENLKIVYNNDRRYHLVDTQIASLWRYQGYLVLEDGSAKGTIKPRRVIIPHRKIDMNTDNSIRNLSAELKFRETLLTDNHTAYEYQVDSKGELQCDGLEGKLYLAYLYLSQRDYRRTQKILQEVTLAKNMGAYSKREFELLLLILHSTNGTDKDFKACALRLKTLALIKDNLAKFGKEPEIPGFKDSLASLRGHHEVSDDIEEYLSQLSHARSFLLSARECQLLREFPTSVSWMRYLGTAGHSKEITREGIVGKQFVEISLRNTNPSNFVNPICADILDKIVMDQGTKVRKNFLSLYHIARNETDLMNRRRLLSWLAWVDDNDRDASLAQILRSVAKNPQRFPDIFQTLRAFAKPGETLALVELRDRRRQANTPSSYDSQIQAAEDQRYEQWRDSIQRHLRTLYWIMEAPSAFQTTVTHFPHHAVVSAVMPKLSIGSPATHSLSSPSLFPEAYLFGEREEKERKVESDLATAPLLQAVDIDMKEHAVKNRHKELLDRIGLCGKEAKSRVEKRGFDELQKDVSDYLNSRASSTHVLKPEQLLRLERDLLEKEKSETELVNKLEADVLELANRKPIDPRKRLRRTFQRDHAQVRDKLSIDELLILILNDDANAIRKRNRALSLEDITELKARVELFLVRKTHQQHVLRALNLINILKDSSLPDDVRQEQMQALQREITAKRNYKIPGDKFDKEGRELEQHYFKYLLIEYQRNLLLRSDQIIDLEKLFVDIIGTKTNNRALQIPMGAGKTDILLVLLALRKADGRQLSIAMIPEELKPTVAAKMQQSGAMIYHQAAHQIDWKTTNTLEGLQEIEKELNDIIATRGFLVVSSTEMHNFALDARENRLECSNRPNDDVFAKEEVFRRIKRILKIHGNVIIDEIDLQKNCRKEVHKALGASVEVGAIYGKITTALYQTIAGNKAVHELFNFEDFIPKRISKGLPFSAAAREQYSKTYSQFENLLATAGLTYLCENGYPALSAYEKELMEYLTDSEAPDRRRPLPVILGLGEKELKDKQELLDALGFIKGQIKTFLPNTLQKIHKQNYGLLPNKDGILSILAGPYESQKPQIGSEFAHYAEQMNYTLQTYLKQGIPAHLLKKELMRIRDNIKKEMPRKRLEDPELSRAYQEYAALCGSIPVDARTVMLCKDADIQTLAKQISENPQQIIQFLGSYILPHIKMYEQRISSNAQTLSNMFHVKHAFAGTIANKDTFSADIITEPREGVDGKTVALLWERSREAIDIIPEMPEGAERESKEISSSGSSGSSKKLDKSMLEKSQEKALYLLREAFKSSKIDSYQAIIDLGGIFQDAPPQLLAEEILRQRKRLSAVFYFDGDKPMTLVRTETGYAIKIGHSLHIKPEDRFVIYGQRQCTGTHFDHAATAKAFVTLNKNSNLRDLLQAVWRMRGLEKSQQVTFIIPQELNNIIKTRLGKTAPLDVLDLILFVEKYQTKQQADDNALSTRQKMQNMIFQECDSILDQIAVERLQEASYQELNNLTLSIVKNSPYLQFGRLEKMIDAKDCLTRNMEALLIPIEKWCKKHPTALLRPNLKALREGMSALIELAVDERKPLVDALLATPVEGPVEGAAAPVALDVAVAVTAQHTIDERRQVNVDQEVRQEQFTLNIPPGASPLKHSTWANTSMLFRSDYFTPISFDAAHKERSESRSAVLHAREALERSTKLGADQFNKRRSVMGKLFANPNLMMSQDLVLTEQGGIPFGPCQKMVDRALIVRDRRTKATKLILIDGADAEEFKTLFALDRKGAKESRGKEAVERDVDLCLVHADTGIYDQPSGERLNLDGMMGMDKNLPMMLLQMKVISGEVTYKKEEADLLKKWFSILDLEELRVFEEYFKTVILNREEVFLHYQGTALAEIFTEIRKAVVI